MEKSQPEKRVFSDQQEAALDEFFKALNIAFKNSAMYFRQHPHFIKGIEDLRVKFMKISEFRNVLEIDIAKDGIFLGGQYFRRGKFPYSEIAHFLHRRKIRSIKIYSNASIQDLGDFVFKVASPVKNQSKEEISLTDFVKNLKGILIEELDYSYLLARRGKYSQDIWETLLSKSSLQAFDSETEHYVAQNIGGIIAEISQEGSILEGVFNNLEKMSQEVKVFPQEEVENFAKEISGSLFRMTPEFLDKFLKGDSFPNLKKILTEHSKKTHLLKNMADELINFKQFKPAFLNLYNIITQEGKDEEKLAREMGKFITQSDFIKDKEKIADSLKELFDTYSANKFISSFYKNTLSFLSDKLLDSSKTKKATQEYIEELSDENLGRDYFYVLMELLRMEDEISDLKFLVYRLKEGLPVIIELGDMPAVKSLIQLLEEKISGSENEEVKKFLSRLRKDICSRQLLNFILNNIEALEETENLVFILKRIDSALTYIVNDFFESKSELTHKKLHKLLQGLADEKIIAPMQNSLKGESNIFILAEAIEILSQVKTKESSRFLEEVYRNNKNNKILLREILMALRKNPFRDKEFLRPILSSKDYFLRKEAIACFLDIADEEEKHQLVNKLLEKVSFLGLEDKIIIENIDILAELGLKKVTPYLLKFINIRPWFFRKRRDHLRAKSLESLMKIDSSRAKEIIPQLSKDKSESIKLLINKFKQK